MFKEIKNIFKKDKQSSKTTNQEKQKAQHSTKASNEVKQNPVSSSVPETQESTQCYEPAVFEVPISSEHKKNRDIKFKKEYMDNSEVEANTSNGSQKPESRSRLQCVASRNTTGTHGSSIVSLDSAWVEDDYDEEEDLDDESEVSRNIEDETDLDEVESAPQVPDVSAAENERRKRIIQHQSQPQSFVVNRTLYPEQSELSEYLLLDKIGEGAFSQVYKSVKFNMDLIYSNEQDFDEEEYEGEYVAIKIINKQMMDSTRKDKPKSTSREQVLKEIMIHKLVSQKVEYKTNSAWTSSNLLKDDSLKKDIDTNSEDGSTHIVRFVDFIETDSYYYMIQELVTGGEIFGEVVKYTYFSEDLSRFVVRQLAFAIKHLHNLGVVHRDIKLENLLYEIIPFFERNPQKDDPEMVLRSSDDPQNKLDEGIFIPGVGAGTIGIVKLADFGLSKKVVNMTGADLSTPCGTVGYTAPEVVRDERYSFQVDLWGIGCVLYTVLCGFPPFYDEKIDVLTEKISKGEYNFLRPWWDEISDGAKNCVSRLLEIDPLKRYTIEELLADPWFSTYDCQEFYSIETKNRINKLQTKVFDRRLKRVLKKQLLNKENDVETQKETANEVDDDFVMTIPIKTSVDTSNTLLYSPAALALRDAFDITNEVQRKKEESSNLPENNSRNMAKQAIAKSAAKNGLGNISEDQETEDFSDYANAVHNNPIDTKFFQLKLNSSTIVKRRHNGVETGSKVKTKSPLANMSI